MSLNFQKTLTDRRSLERNIRKTIIRIAFNNDSLILIQGNIVLSVKMDQYQDYRYKRLFSHNMKVCLIMKLPR